jgi:starvation-inducible DNA-binding protein
MPTATANHLFSSSVNLSERTRNEIISILNDRLADTLDLKLQTKHAHWNVKGSDFIQLHELFDEIATHIEEQTDLIAERVTALGGVAKGTARQVAAGTSLKEYELEAVSGEEHLKALSARLADVANKSREAIDSTDRLGDKATADIFTEIARAADKDLWFLEAHLQK